jgi:hypothetical protein
MPNQQDFFLPGAYELVSDMLQDFVHRGGGGTELELADFFLDWLRENLGPLALFTVEMLGLANLQDLADLAREVLRQGEGWDWQDWQEEALAALPDQSLFSFLQD